METVEATLGKEKISFRCPTQEEYDRFAEKLARRQKPIAARELLMSTCESHSVEELSALLETKPAAIVPIATAIDTELSGVSLEPEIVGDTVELEGVIFRMPSLSEWESLQGAGEKAGTRFLAEARSHLVMLATGDATKLFQDKPGAVAPVMDIISGHIGADVEIEVKKG